jgi:hypothetical protein
MPKTLESNISPFDRGMLGVLYLNRIVPQMCPYLEAGKFYNQELRPRGQGIRSVETKSEEEGKTCEIRCEGVELPKSDGTADLLPLCLVSCGIKGGFKNEESRPFGLSAIITVQQR